MNNILYTSIIFISLINAYVSYKVLRSELYDKSQKVFQLLIIWFIPLFGMALVLFFLRDELASTSRKDKLYERDSEVSYDSATGSVGD